MPGPSFTPIRYSSILFPTDFGPGSEVAFAHALRLALHNRSRLTLLHAGGRAANPDWKQFPGVRAMLERWGLLEPGAGRNEVGTRLGVEVEKVTIRGRGIVNSILDFMDDHRVDLLVLATAGNEGLDRLFQGSVAEPLSRQSVVTTLFVPNGARAWVSAENGTVTANRILVPMAHRPSPEVAVDAAMTMLTGFGEGKSALTLFHVGDEASMPGINAPLDGPWAVERYARPGDVSHEIVMAADDYQSDVVVMSTEGRQGFRDAVGGSMTERVIRRSPCPVMAVPAE